MKRFAVTLSLLLASYAFSQNSALPKSPQISAPKTWAGFSIIKDFVPASTFGRTRMLPMKPLYITVHSTQNFAKGANALAHARGQREGNFKSTHNKLGYLAWHFTVDDTRIVQSLPCNEQGQHADYEGPGNKTSIGIEMCEDQGNHRAQTTQRTARLCAILMAKYGIPISHVVPHQYWRRIRYDDNRDLGHKNCPHFLLHNEKPSKKWLGFQNQVLAYYQALRIKPQKTAHTITPPSTPTEPQNPD